MHEATKDKLIELELLLLNTGHQNMVGEKRGGGEATIGFMCQTILAR